MLRGRLLELLANERRRFDYRHLLVLLRGKGELSGINRIYREKGLAVRKRKARRKAVGTRAPILVRPDPTHAGHWNETEQKQFGGLFSVEWA